MRISYAWHHEELRVRVNAGMFQSSLDEAAGDLPACALACLAAKRTRQVVVTPDNGRIAMAVANHDDEAWCVDVMRGYRAGTPLDWSGQGNDFLLSFIPIEDENEEQPSQPEPEEEPTTSKVLIRVHKKLFSSSTQ